MLPMSYKFQHDVRSIYSCLQIIIITMEPKGNTITIITIINYYYHASI